MSYVVLHADALATVLTDDPIVPAAQAPTVRDAVALLAAVEGACAQACETGRAEGFEAGRREGRVAGEEEMRGELFQLALRAQRAEPRRREEVARLAVEVVRRIAGAVGDEAMVAGLAERATAAIAPDQTAVVRVPPSVAAAVAERLGERPGVTIEPDPAHAGADCVVQTPLGSVRAGLETQLAQIKRIWGEAGGER